MRRLLKILAIFTLLVILLAPGPVAAQRHAPEFTAEVRVPQGSNFPGYLVNGKPFDPSGRVASRSISAGFGAIRSEMDQCLKEGYGCFFLRLDWQGLEPVEGGLKLDTLQRVLNYADDIGLKVIAGLEMDAAPAWFLNAHPEALETTRYPDPEVDTAMGNITRDFVSGDLKHKDGSGVIGYHWPDTAYRWEETDFYREVRIFWEEFIGALRDQLDDHPSFIGWAINTPVSPLGFPGGGVDGVLGMSGYSPAKRDLYFQVSGGRETPSPLERYSQAFPDGRVDWLEFTAFRLENRRKFIDFIGNTIKSNDPYHPVLFYPGHVLSYAADNGYLAESEGLDWGYYMGRDYIDGVVLPFQFSSVTFAAGFNPGHGEPALLRAAVRAAINHKKLPFVWVERAADAPSRSDFEAFAAMIKVWGAYPLYSEPLRWHDSERWGKDLTRRIEATSFYSLLPPPTRRQKAKVAVLDYPYFFSKFYSEKDGALRTACIQLEILNQAGVPFDLLDVNEILSKPDVLNNYSVVIPLASELLKTEFYSKSGLEGIIDRFKDPDGATKGMMYTTHPIKLREFAEGGFNDQNYIEEVRVEFVRLGCSPNQLSSNDITLAVAQPYIFVYPQKHRYESILNVGIEGWTSSGMSVLQFLDVLNGRKMRADVFTSLARLDLNLLGGRPYLFAETSSVIEVVDDVHAKRASIDLHQTEEAMRRFVPISLAVCIIMLLLLAFYSLHGFKDRMRQQAFRIEGAQQLDDFDAVELERIRMRMHIKDLDNPAPLKRIVAAAALGEMGADASDALAPLRSKVHSETDEYAKQAILGAIAKIEGYE